MTISEFNKFRFKKGQQVTLKNGTVGVLETVDFSDNTVLIFGKIAWIKADEIESIDYIIINKTRKKRSYSTIKSNKK